MKNKTKCMGIATALALLVGVATAASAQTRKACDANNNGTVDNADIGLLNGCVSAACPTLCGGIGEGTLFPAPNPNAVRCGDGFGDGTAVNTADVGLCARLAIGLPNLHDQGCPVGADAAGCVGALPTCSGTCTGGVRNGLACVDESDCPTINVGSGDITASVRWPANCRVNLTGTVRIKTNGNLDNADTCKTVLTIDGRPSVAVTGDTTAAAVPALFILPGARIGANGAPTDPIIMTSNNPPHSPNDWGGLNILGRSTVNTNTTGTCTGFAEGVPEAFGGCIEDDNSGIVTYTSVRFAGRLFTPDNELNSITMNAVGSGTEYHHVQAHFGADDCHEWFGGTVNTHHLVASGCGDDGFDWQLGFTGSLQYGLMFQNSGNLSAGSGQSRGIEADNSEFGFEDLPRSNPSMCNLTLIGAQGAAGSDTGIFLRRGTAGTIGNSVIVNWQDVGTELGDTSTCNIACSAANTLNPNQPNLRVKNSIFFDNGAGNAHTKSSAPAGCVCGAELSKDWYDELVANEGVRNASGVAPTVDPQLSQTYPPANQVPDARSNPNPVFTAGDCTAVNENFEDTAYVGALDPMASCNTSVCDWLDTSWVSFNTN